MTADFYSMRLHSQPETDGLYTVKLLAPSPEALRKVSKMIDNMKIDQTWIFTELRPWASLNTVERNQYPSTILLDPGMLQSLRLSLTLPGTWYFYLLALLSPSDILEKIRALERQVADLNFELAGYQMASGTSGSREKIQVFKLGNEFLRAAKTATPTTYEVTPNLLSNITAFRDIMSNPGSPPTVPQITSSLSACFAPLFQHLNSTYQTLLASHQQLEATKDELATLKAINEDLQQQVGQYSFNHLLRTPLTQSINVQSEIEAPMRHMSEDLARLTVEENQKTNSKHKGKAGSSREPIRLSEERHSTPANSGSIESPDVPMVDSTTAPEKQNARIRLLVLEQEVLTRSLEGEKNMRLGVELELADLKAQYELQEKFMLHWFLKFVIETNGEAYLKHIKTLKDIRPKPPSESQDSFYRLL